MSCRDVPTRPGARGQNVRVTPRALAITAVPLAALALLASGCGGNDAAKASASASATPSPSVTLPAGVDLTKAGSSLSFGDAATVAFVANAKKSTGLTLGVSKVVKARIADLAAYQLDATTKTSTPYYVTVSVENVGTGDVGGSVIPLWALSSDDTLIGASGFTNSFGTCPSRALPTSFAAGDDLTTCLMYLVPKGGSLVGVSYRPLISQEPIVWKGTVSSGPTQKSAEKKSTQKSMSKG